MTTVREPTSSLDAALGLRVVGAGPRIAMATSDGFPDGADEGVLAEALAHRRAEARWAVWDDPEVDWADFDLVVVRSTWDYAAKLDAFRAWVQQVAMATTLVNPPRLIVGNLHKGYLADLGPEAVPTVVVPRGMTLALAQLPWADVVVKPAVGAGGVGVVRHATQADLDALTLADENPADAVVQPYLASVERAGEVSVTCIDGHPTHAVRKLPADGGFLVHAHLGGSVEPVRLTAALADVALRTLARLPMPTVYARVDLLDAGGDLVVGELELVEPDLALAGSSEATERFADTLLARATAGSGLS
jgi:glutathione synthase/RimK-type ligase-like ATP-grasp enzyme